MRDLDRVSGGMTMKLGSDTEFSSSKDVNILDNSKETTNLYGSVGEKR